jgi:hypothetical protein
MELPNQFYYIAGFLVITNLGTIGAVIFAGFKLTGAMATKRAELKAADEATDNKADLANGRIDRLEGKVWK